MKNPKELLQSKIKFLRKAFVEIEIYFKDNNIPINKAKFTSFQKRFLTLEKEYMKLCVGDDSLYQQSQEAFNKVFIAASASHIPQSEIKTLIDGFTQTFNKKADKLFDKMMKLDSDIRNYVAETHKKKRN